MYNGFRPFSSWLWICVPVISPCTDPESVCKTAAVETTSTVSVELPIVKAASRDNAEFAFNMLCLL